MLRICCALFWLKSVQQITRTHTFEHFRIDIEHFKLCACASAWKLLFAIRKSVDPSKAARVYYSTMCRLECNKINFDDKWDGTPKWSGKEFLVCHRDSKFFITERKNETNCVTFIVFVSIVEKHTHSDEQRTTVDVSELEKKEKYQTDPHPIGFGIRYSWVYFERSNNNQKTHAIPLTCTDLCT